MSAPTPPPAALEHEQERVPAAVRSALAASTAADYTAPTHTLTRLANAGLLVFAIGASVALTVHLFLVPDLPAFLKSNALATETRRTMVLSAIGSGIGACLLPLLYLGARRSEEALVKIERWAKLASPLLMTVPLPFFFDWRVFRDNELLCVATASLWGLAMEQTFRVAYGALGEGPLRRLGEGLLALSPRWVPRLPMIVVGLMTAAFGLYFSYYSIQNHYNLQTTSWDLAIFDNMMWNLLRGKWFKASPDLGRTGSHIQYHATFDAYLFLPFYALRQKADTLLALQAIFAGAACIPLYLLAKKRMQSALAALALVYAYCVHGPLHGPIFYDFHFLTTAPFFIGMTLWCFETNRKGWLIATYVAAILLREDQSATLATAALFYLLAGDRPVWAMIGGITSGLTFVLLKFVIMPMHMSGAPKETFSWMYNGLIPNGEGGFGAVLRTLLTNPVFVLKTLIIEEKFQYIMKMFAPVLFLSFRSSRTWVIHLAPMVFTLLSTGYSPLVQTYFQYSSNWTSYLFFGAAVTMGSWRGLPDAKVRIRAAAAAIFVVATALSYNHGAIFQHNTFRGGFVTVKFRHGEEDQKNIQDLYALIAMIPKGVSVAATEHEAPHVSNREDCFTLRFGHDDADYILVSTAEARSGNSHDNLDKALKTGQYGFAGSRGKFALWGKKLPTDRNAEGAALVGLKP